MLKTVAIQGQEASFHAIAALEYFGIDISFVACETFADTFKALKNGEANKAVVAIENSLFGSINEVYDLLLKHKFWITGEVYLRIEQCLIGLPGASIDDIQEVHSHPVALAQCEVFLDTKIPKAERFEHHDTAGSVIDIKKWGDPTKAAIASKASADLHGMKVLAREIETNKQNYTRFVVLEPTRNDVIKSNKTSMIITTDHKAGALYNALGTFAKQRLNLSKLQSRPIIGQAWHYMFYVDVSAGIDNPKLQKALKDLEMQNCHVSILGSYRAGEH